MPASSPAHVPVRSIFFASKGIGSLSQRAATSGDGLGDAGRLALADGAAAWLPCPAPADAVGVVAGDAVVAQAATTRTASTGAASRQSTSFINESPRAGPRPRRHEAPTGRRPSIRLVHEGRLPNVSGPSVNYAVRVICSRVNFHQTQRMDDSQNLRRRLEAACVRLDREPPSSPEWDAAMEEIEDLTVRLGRVEGDTVAA